MPKKNYSKFLEDIKTTIPQENIFTSNLYNQAFGADASFYKLNPKLTIRVDNGEQARSIILKAYELNLPLTFRTAGTSLSGQGISNSILMLCSDKFTNFRLNEDKSEISLEPALRGSQVNEILARYNKKIGPDPATIDTAMIGGIAANNASGMCCGVAQNSYKTLKSIKAIFADGTALDTSSQKSKNDFSKTHKDFLKDLEELSLKTKSKKELNKLIEKKFKIKNTCGYSLNALIDYEDVFDILSHLLIGSEGTLAFIEEVTYYTVLDAPFKASALVFFEHIEEACKCVSSLKIKKDAKELIVDAVELMDSRALKSVLEKEGMPKIKNFDEKSTTALLIETRALKSKDLKSQVTQIEDLIKNFSILNKTSFTTDPKVYSLYWKMRKGLLPSVGALRKEGTTFIVEDVAFPIKDLPAGVLSLHTLFEKYALKDALIFGHALEGNVHFVFTQDFTKKKEVEKYNDFMNDLANDVALKYQGSLKAEHGTGRNMASFVELEWGKSAYALMWDIKKIFDEKNILNPDVILNLNPKAHLENLKISVKAHKLIDKCIECGFCEPLCPSRNLTLTPRQRIVVYRQIKILEKNGDLETAKELEKDYQYSGIDTCATCSLCSTLCPLGIDVGAFIKDLRAKQVSERADKIASKISNNFSTTLKLMNFGLNSANIVHLTLGTNNMTKLCEFSRKISKNKISRWSPYLPKGQSLNTSFTSKEEDKKVVYYPSCISRAMGQSAKSIEGKNLFDTVVMVLQKAGFEVILPKNLKNLCCGMPFSSKGYMPQAKQKAKELEDALNEASLNGKYPVLCDTSPCVKKNVESFTSSLKVYEPIEFCLEILSKYLDFEPIDEKITIHITCSSKKMGLEEKFLELVKLCAKDVHVPKDVSCCGFAGDRGFSFPELNKKALKNLSSSLKENNVKLAFSTSKTCEIGLSEHSGLDYNSIFYLVNACTKAKN